MVSAFPSSIATERLQPQYARKPPVWLGSYAVLLVRKESEVMAALLVLLPAVHHTNI
jgi:hypothetical protein